MRVPGFEPGISPPQGEVLTTILHTPGEAGYRSLYLSHAKRALYHLSYIPGYHTDTMATTIYALRTTLASPRSLPYVTRITLPSRILAAHPASQNRYANNRTSDKAFNDALALPPSVYRSLYHSSVHFIDCCIIPKPVEVLARSMETT